MQPRTTATYVGHMSLDMAAYNTDTLWLMFFVALLAFGIISLACLGWHYSNQIAALNAKRNEVERENNWLTRLNQDMRQFLITKGLVDEFKAHVYKLYTPVPIPAPTLEEIKAEVLSHIAAAKPADSEVSNVIVLPPEREPQANGSAPPPTVLH